MKKKYVVPTAKVYDLRMNETIAATCGTRWWSDTHWEFGIRMCRESSFTTGISGMDGNDDCWMSEITSLS